MERPQRATRALDSTPGLSSLSAGSRSGLALAGEPISHNPGGSPERRGRDLLRGRPHPALPWSCGHQMRAGGRHSGGHHNRGELPAELDVSTLAQRLGTLPNRAGQTHPAVFNDFCRRLRHNVRRPVLPDRGQSGCRPFQTGGALRRDGRRQAVTQFPSAQSTDSGCPGSR